MNVSTRTLLILSCLICAFLGLVGCKGNENAFPSHIQVVARSSEVNSALTEVKWSPIDPNSLILRGENITDSGFLSPLYLLDLESKTIKPLSLNGKQVSALNPSWSFHGRLVSFFDLNALQIRTIDLNNLSSTKTLPIQGEHTILAPDGQRFATINYTRPAVTVRLLDIQGRELDVVTKFSDETLQDVGHSAWSPTMERIALALKHTSGVKDYSQGDMYLLSLRDKHLLRMTSTSQLDEDEPAWSPDGRYLVFTSRPVGPSTERHLIIANADGSCPQTVSNLNGFQSPSWSPDGKQLAVVSVEGNVSIIDVASLDIDLSKQRLTCSTQK
jgi:WD40 repeat protein